MAKPARFDRTSSFTCSTPPTSSIAARRASRSFIPCFIFFSVRRSAYEPNSSLRSRSIRCLRIVLRIRLPPLEKRLIRRSRRSQRAADRDRDTLPVFGFGLELPAARAGQAVILRAPIVFGFAPLRFEPTRFLHSVQGGEERARLYVESALGDLIDAGGDAQAVERLRRERLEHQQVESPLKKIGCELIVAIAHIDNL